MTLAEALAALALALVAAAAVVDVVRYQIPDLLSLGVIGLAGAFGLLTPGFGWLSHAAAPAAMFALGLLAFSRGWLGGGDVKLMTAIAAWTGLAGLPLMFLATSISGGALALVYAVGRRALHRAPAAATPNHLPYAVAIACGTLWWLAVTRGGPLA